MILEYFAFSVPFGPSLISRARERQKQMSEVPPSLRRRSISRGVASGVSLRLILSACHRLAGSSTDATDFPSRLISPSNYSATAHPSPSQPQRSASWPHGTNDWRARWLIVKRILYASFPCPFRRLCSAARAVANPSHSPDQSKSGITIRLVSPDSLDKFVGTFPGPEGALYHLYLTSSLLLLNRERADETTTTCNQQGPHTKVGHMRLILKRRKGTLFSL